MEAERLGNLGFRPKVGERIGAARGHG
jgi:hypothetical protein